MTKALSKTLGLGMEKGRKEVQHLWALGVRNLSRMLGKEIRSHQAPDERPGANRRRQLQEGDEALGRSSAWSPALRGRFGVRERKAQLATRGARNDTKEKLKPVCNKTSIAGMKPFQSLWGRGVADMPDAAESTGE